jgi:hypothetical protein
VTRSLKIAAFATIATFFFGSGSLSSVRTADARCNAVPASASGHPIAVDRHFSPAVVDSVAAAAPTNGYKPIGTATINGRRFVVFASQDAAQHNYDPGDGHGFVDVFDKDGKLIRRLAALEHSDSNWETFEYVPVPTAESKSHR